MARVRTGGDERLVGLAVVLLCMTAPVSAHPTPFTYVDLRVTGDHLTITIAAHIVDAAHDLSVSTPETLLLATASPDMTPLARLLEARLDPSVDGRNATCSPAGDPERLQSTQFLRWSFSCDIGSSAEAIAVNGPLFPYDPQHQTFVNLYVGGALTGQQVLDAEHHQAAFILRQAQPRRVVVGRFLAAGIEHILSGPDHLLFLAGLLLLGGSIGRLAAIVTAFTLAHSVTLALAVLDVIAPPPALIEPLIALSIVYVGISNLRTSGAGDWRALTAGAFGLIHGFGFAYALREMQLPRRDLGWSLFAFNCGVELGQLGVVLITMTIFDALKKSGLVSPRRLVVGGSVVVAVAGLFWLVERGIALWAR
jgi:hydrogenase/urease accessory protein HupE